MFQKAKSLFKLFGFQVRVDPSWLLLALLIVWSLASGYFPASMKGHPDGVYWAMGIIGAVGIFVSIVFHEMSHALVARKYGLPIGGITLFIFGGVAEMESEPKRPGTEFAVAIAGPIASVILGSLFLALHFGAQRAGLSAPILGVLTYLFAINFILAGFNLIPAFPLDGGRILRAAIWVFNDDLKKSTKIVTTIGSGFGLFLIILGVLQLFSGRFIAGAWWILIGLFLRNASKVSYRQLLFRRALEGERIDRFMARDCVQVSPSMSIRDFVENVIYEHQFKMYPVTEEDALIGCVKMQHIRQLSRDEWETHTVSDCMERCNDENSVHPDEDPMNALTKMNKTKASRLLVVEDGKLKGIVALKDLLRFLSFKIDLEGDDL